jgi:serine/threonine-protein kinase
MGEVWAATDLLMGGSVALKFLDGRLPPGDAQKQLLKEASLASRVRHQNVVNVHSFFVLADGRPAMSMDALEGETLRKKLDREEALPLSVAASILLPVVSAVGTAHANGVIHRDLKPENVFLTPAMGGQLYVRVLDFGIAKLMRAANSGDATGTLRTDGVRGTILYMSPEQARREELDHRTDIWSLGVLMYEVLAGSRPVEASTFREVARRLEKASITPLRTHVPDLPDQVLALVDRMLQRRPEARPQDLREVAEVLARYTNVVVPDFGVPRPEALLPPDSSPTSARPAVVQVVEKSDPYAATEVVVADVRGPSSIGEPATPRPHSPQRLRGAHAGVATLAISALVGAWFWPHQRAPEPALVARAAVASATVRMIPPQPHLPLPTPLSTSAEPTTEVSSALLHSADGRPKSALHKRTAPSLHEPQKDDAPTASGPRIRFEPPTEWQPDDHRMAAVPGLH